MTTTDQSLNQAVRELMKLMDQLQGQLHQDYYRCFSTFLGVTHECLERARWGDLAWKPELDDKVQETLARMLAVLLGQLIPEPTYQDVLGAFYMELGTASKGFGQFFTPWHVARLSAELTLHDLKLETYTRERPLTICDPACGSGIMLLAAASILPRSFIDEGRAAFYGMDIDGTCVQMAKINARLYGLDGVPAFIKNTAEVTPEELERLPEPYQEQVKAQIEQLAMFEEEQAA